MKQRVTGIPVIRHVDGKLFKLALPLCSSKKIVEKRKNELRKMGYKRFRTFKEGRKTAVYASK